MGKDIKNSLCRIFLSSDEGAVLQIMQIFLMVEILCFS